MLLRKLVLHNIRSYKDATVLFPEGIVLLSGDIGAGKTTILLAIEFALFGIQRGEIASNALLRHGENQGWVELSFEIDKHSYQVVRTLKRSNTAISQDSGYLMRDGIREDLTSTELKAHILDLLGYPADLLTKGKSVLFRYTVYTPQEEMKRILEEAPEERLITLRRLFGIEKYERVRDNAKIVLQSLREQERELDGVLSRLPAQRALATELGIRQQEVATHLQTILPQLTQARAIVMDTRTRIRENEAKLNELFALKREVTTVDAQEKVQREQDARLERELIALEKQIVQPAPPLMDTASIVATKRQTEQSITETDRALVDARGMVVELRTKSALSMNVAKGVENLENCPTCKQAVPREHRSRIMQDEQARCQAFAAEQEHYNARMLSLSQQLTQHKQVLETLRSQEQQAAMRTMEVRLAEERRARYGSLKDQQVLTRNALRTFTQQRESAATRLRALADVETLHTTLMTTLDQAQEHEKQLSVAHGKLSQQTEELTKQLSATLTDIGLLEIEHQRRASIAAFRDWLANRFVPLVGTIESHVLATVQHDFNALLVALFSILIDDPLLSASIGKDFGVVLQQNGYDTGFDNLSGGERTASALAYRLALNRVVNDLATTINTRELLILDEPTDGFSSEQLEKVRDVLRELRCKQILLVSHEAALEGFVDSVLRIEKHEHSSDIA